MRIIDTRNFLLENLPLYDFDFNSYYLSRFNFIPSFAFSRPSCFLPIPLAYTVLPAYVTRPHYQYPSFLLLLLPLLLLRLPES